MYLQYESLLNALPSVTFFVQFLAVGRSLVQLSAPCAAETVAPWLMASGDDSWSSVTTKGLPRMPAGMHFPCTVCYALPRVQRAGQRKVTPPNKDEAERPATVTHTSDNDGAQSERQALQHETRAHGCHVKRKRRKQMKNKLFKENKLMCNQSL